jgi:hypothetical protein
MGDGSGSVTLIFYRVGAKWWKEPALNLLAAAAQRSAYTHVELAIGEDALDDGSMTNVVRVFNDPVGCEVTSRTGRNPLYSYVSLGCSKNAERRMLAFARQQIGKSFSNVGMARSLIWPRQSDYTTFFCAELVAAVLKVGGLMSMDSNPGAATPYSLFKTYSKSGAATANPFVLRAVNNLSDRQSLLPISMPRSGLPPHARPLPVAAKRRQSPPRAAFRNLTLGAPRTGPVPGTVVLTLNSLR